MNRTKKLSMGFAVLMLLCIFGSSAAAPGVAAGDSYGYDMTVDVSGDFMGTAIDETVKGSLTVSVTDVTDNTITYDIKYDIKGDYASGFTDSTGMTSVVSTSFCATAGVPSYFIDAACTTKSSSTEISNLTTSVSYDENGVLTKAVYGMNLMGLNMVITIEQSGGGVPAYPMVALAFAALGAMAFIIRKRK